MKRLGPEHGFSLRTSVAGSIRWEFVSLKGQSALSEKGMTHSDVPGTLRLRNRGEDKNLHRIAEARSCLVLTRPFKFLASG